jgi:hypothetical protein
MTIAYTPLNIDVQLPDADRISTWFKNNQTIPLENFDLLYNEEFTFVPVYLRMSYEDWLDPKLAMEHYNNRWNSRPGQGRYLFDIEKILPEIPYMINQLPYKELTQVFMMYQKNHVDPHYDSEIGDTYEDPSEISIDNEPHRINILLTNHGEKNFYLSEFKNSERIYPKITKEKSCYAYVERYYWHGSDYTKSGRYLLSTFGIVDKEKHKKMIADSVLTYPEEIISFPDVGNPNDFERQFLSKEDRLE